MNQTMQFKSLKVAEYRAIRQWLINRFNWLYADDPMSRYYGVSVGPSRNELTRTSESLFDLLKRLKINRRWLRRYLSYCCDRESLALKGMPSGICELGLFDSLVEIKTLGRPETGWPRCEF